MGISQKHRRKIVVASRDFYWSVRPDPSWAYRQPVGSEQERVLAILTTDRRFIATLPVDRMRLSLPDCALTLSGPDFRGLFRARGFDKHRYLQVDVPRELIPTAERITPGFVRVLIEWTLSNCADAASAPTPPGRPTPRRRSKRG